MLFAILLASSMVSTLAISASAFVSRPIDVSERLAVSILHLVAARNLLDRPRWGKATYMILVCAPADEIADDKTDPERKHQRSREIVFHEFFGFLRRLRGIVPGAAILAARALADAMRKL